jgi:site-specific DNA-methyltransferase (adenine-specific)
VTAPEPYYEDESVRLFLGDCLDVLRTLEADSIDAIVTDPPYGLEFMGKKWDSFGRDTGNGYREKPRMTADHMGKGFKELPNHFEAGRPFQRWCEAWAIECLRVLKPGGHLLAFGGTRTWHRMVCAIEDAGFEIRDSISWIYGNGFPKSLNVSAAIDKHLGATRPVVETIPDRWAGKGDVLQRATQDVRAEAHITSSATAAAAAAEGWGTALKPAHEPIVVARKPLAGTVAANVLAFSTGALNIDGCRIGTTRAVPASHSKTPTTIAGVGLGVGDRRPASELDPNIGRWPPNVVLGEEAAAELDRQSGTLTSGANPARRKSDKFRDAYGEFAGQEECTPHRDTDSGGASRFFPVFRYEAKAAAHERPRSADGTAHPTVKPVDLMSWLVRLVTPPGGTVLDPFGGSGTTAEACIVEGFRCVLIEQDPAYAELIKTRLRKPIQPTMFGMESA